MASLAALTYIRLFQESLFSENTRAQNCKQNVFTQWHIFIYLLNNYLAGRNNVTACTESFVSQWCVGKTLSFICVHCDEEFGFFFTKRFHGHMHGLEGHWVVLFFKI